MDKVHFISSSDLIKYVKRSRLWYTGWVTAIFILGVAIYESGYVRAYWHLQNDNIKMMGQLQSAVFNINKLTEGFVKAWATQQMTTETLINYGEWVKNRQELVDENRGIKLKKVATK